MELDKGMCGHMIVLEQAGPKVEVFITGTFTTPAWVPTKMEAKELDNGRVKYSIFCRIPDDSKVEYKFCVGETQFVDETQETSKTA